MLLYNNLSIKNQHYIETFNFKEPNYFFYLSNTLAQSLSFLPFINASNENCSNISKLYFCFSHKQINIKNIPNNIISCFSHTRLNWTENMQVLTRNWKKKRISLLLIVLLAWYSKCLKLLFSYPTLNQCFFIKHKLY